MTDSPILGLPTPGEDDLPDSPAQIQALIDRLEALRGGYSEIGAMTDYAGQTDPNPTSGCWMITDGRILLRTDYPALYTLIGTRFNTGGEATTEFRIPLIARRMVYAAQAGDTPGAVGGAPTVTLGVTQMPVHRHGGATGNDSPDHAHSGTTGNDSPDHAHGPVPGSTIYLIAGGAVTNASSASATGGTLKTAGATGGATARHTHAFGTGGASARHAHSINNEGGGAAHENMPPYITFFKIIRVR